MVFRNFVKTAIMAALLAVMCGSVQAGNIDAVNKYAWGENAGWLNFNPTDGSVAVYSDHLEGYAWNECIGWIRLGAYTGGGSHSYDNSSNTTYGVNNDGSGNLSGYAWSENFGWINFKPTGGGVSIDASGNFSGYAWGEGIGWIHFGGTASDSSAYKVIAIQLLPSIEPTVQASSVSFTSVTGTSLTLNWTNGDGSNHLIVMKSGSAVDSNPADGTSYIANTVFGSGSQIGSANYVVYNGRENSVTVSGLTAGTTYYVAVYEFNGSGGSENYLITSPAAGSALAKNSIVIAQGSSVSVIMDEDGSPKGWTAPIITASDADSDKLTWSLGTAPAHGTATVSGSGASPTIIYSPTADYNGSDAFTVQLSDGNGGTASISVNVTINPVNDPPVSNADNYSVNQDNVLSIAKPGVLTNDTDTDRDTLKAVKNQRSGKRKPDAECGRFFHLHPEIRFFRHGQFHLQSK